MSDITQKYKKRYKILTLLSIMLNLVPLAIYSVYGFIQGSIGEKVTLSITLIICIIFVAINLVFKYHIRSTIWILLLGIQICLKNITVLLIIIALLTILDEFIISPLSKKYKTKFVINNEIDEREENV